jgi:hypothetical protein
MKLQAATFHWLLSYESETALVHKWLEWIVAKYLSHKLILLHIDSCGLG